MSRDSVRTIFVRQSIVSSMGYKFKSDLVDSGGTELPDYSWHLARELLEQVRGYDFTQTAESDGVSVRMFEHSLEETQAFVDWAVTIWNTEFRSVHRSRRISTDEFLSNMELRDGGTPIESALVMFECWLEGNEKYTGPYLSTEIFPYMGPSKEPFATIGNLSAAVGLAVLDNLVMNVESMTKEQAMYSLSRAWEFASIARWSNHLEMGLYFEVEGAREAKRRAARARHVNDPKQAVKQEVRGLWQSWEDEPSRYPSIAAFARDMCDKWPESLTSEVVVSRWVREWRKEGKQ